MAVKVGSKSVETRCTYQYIKARLLRNSETLLKDLGERGLHLGKPAEASVHGRSKASLDRLLCCTLTTSMEGLTDLRDG